VHYVEPVSTNEAAWGFNLASSQPRLDAITRAQDTNLPVASSRISLVQSVEPQYGFLYFEPMTTAAGLILAVFKCDEMLKTALENFALKNVEVFLYDKSEGEDSYLAHYFEGTKASEEFDAFKDALSSTTLGGRHKKSITYEMEVGFRKWEITCGVKEAYYEQEASNVATLIFFIAIAMTFVQYLARVASDAIYSRASGDKKKVENKERDALGDTGQTKIGSAKDSETAKTVGIEQSM